MDHYEFCELIVKIFAFLINVATIIFIGPGLCFAIFLSSCYMICDAKTAAINALRTIFRFGAHWFVFLTKTQFIYQIYGVIAKLYDEISQWYNSNV